MTINIEPEIKSICPTLTLAIIRCKIQNTAYNATLWSDIDNASQTLRAQTSIPDIKKKPIIAATRQAYKKCGKDPNRYRPSSEALCRRIISGKDLYQISTGVDVINLLSFTSGYSIGAFDAEQITGNLSYGIGKANEAYTGIGRGSLNIEGLPILRDEKGGIGTPTSDEERTKLSLDTTQLLVNINGYLGKEHLSTITSKTIKLLKTYLCAQDINLIYIE